ncbi:MAG: type II CAAX endopeptidase family protein [Acidobacteriaceae bacterium]
MSDLPLPEPVRTDQALDIQHDTDPADEHGNAHRIPHLGHALLFFSLMGFCILVVQVLVLFAVHGFTPPAAMQHPYALAAGLMIGYALTFAIAIPAFRAIWGLPFLRGISWTWRAARLRWWKLLLLGCALSVIAQLLERFIKSPVTSDISQLLRNPLAAWLTVILGTLIAPVVEEVAFRGFLLPALATAYDWLALDRTPAGLHRWLRGADHTLGALIFGTLLSSFAFAALHGTQLHWAIGPLVILFVMSLAFSAVRIRTRSVAASTLVHVAYDALIFVEVAIATAGFHHLDKL